MRFLLALSLVFCLVFFGPVSATSFSAVPNYSDYTFERFEVEFGKKYSSIGSRENHKRIFNENLNKIKAHNSQLSGKNYFMKINQHADLSEQTIASKFTGRSQSVALNQKKRLLKGTIPYTSPIQASQQDLPASVDWRNQGAVTPVKDQGGCGSCWAFSAVASIESQYILSEKSQVILSPQHTLECTPNPKHCGGTGGCKGATAELAFEWAKAGIASEATIPYRGVDAACPSNVTAAAKIAGWVKLPENNDTALLEAVAFIGPISVSVDASSWSFYGGGVFNGCNAKSPVINHAVQLVGYGHDAASNQDYWLIRNSWGKSWGESGYIRLYRGKNESCGMDTQPGDGSACDGETDPVKVCGTCGVWYDSSYPTGVTKA